MNADKAFKRFFKHQRGFPKFKKKNKSDAKMYFVKTDAKTIILCERVLVEEKEQEKPQLNDFGLGIDLGVKEFAVISNGSVKKNINKTKRVKKLEKKLKREQRCLSRKYEDLKKRNKKKGEATRQNIQKQVLKVQKLHHRIEYIWNDEEQAFIKSSCFTEIL